MFPRAAAALASTMSIRYSSELLRRAPVSQIRVQKFSSFRLPNQHRPALRPQAINVASQRHLHPALLVVARQFVKLVAMLTGRAFRKWWKDLPLDKRRYFLGKIREHKTGIALTSGGLGAGIGVYYFSHLQTTPITNRTRFIAFNEEQMMKINEFSRDMQYELIKNQLVPSDHPLLKRVSKVAERLLNANRDIEEIFSKEWTVSVINSPIENAFVSPSGQICVFSGMLGLCENDDQLGCVLAHEMSHAILNHGGEQMSYAHLLDFFIIVALAAIWAIMPSDGIAAVTHWFFNKVCTLMLDLPYSRQLEIEADAVGMELAAKACFDVRENSAFWAKMSLMKELQGEEPVPEFLSSHPDNAKRAETLDAMMPDALKKRIECRCPPLPRLDPRLSVDGLKHQIHAAKKWREAIARDGVLIIPVSRG